MLFIHGSTDTTVPTSMVFDNYYACASEKELYVVEGKGYNETYTSPEYFNRLFSYIDKHIHEQTLDAAKSNEYKHSNNLSNKRYI